MVSGRASARGTDDQPGWVKRKFRDLDAKIAALQVGKLSAVPGSVVSIQQVLTDPNGSMKFLNTDTTTATADDSTVTLDLTYFPVPGSLHVRQNGLDLLESEWSLSGHTVTIAPATELIVRDDDVFDAAYAYDTITGIPAVIPVSLTLTGGAGTFGSNGPALTGLALDAATGLNELLAVSVTAGTTVTDARLTQVGSTGLWLGFATDLTTIAATHAGGFGEKWAISYASFQTNATGWTEAALTPDTALVSGNTLPIATVSNTSAAIVALFDGHSIIGGYMDTPTGWTLAQSSGVALAHTVINYWGGEGAFDTTPPGPSTFNGGDGGAGSVTVGLIA